MIANSPSVELPTGTNCSGRGKKETWRVVEGRREIEREIKR